MVLREDVRAVTADARWTRRDAQRYNELMLLCKFESTPISLSSPPLPDVWMTKADLFLLRLHREYCDETDV